MSLDMSRLLPPGSHAWCSDCDWTNLGQDCHRHGRTHGALLTHIVHVYEPDTAPEGWVEGTFACGDATVSPMLGLLECVRERGHEGRHSARRLQWPND